MTIFNITTLPISTVLYLYTEQDDIFLEPDYQRMSDVWTLEKRQLLIDSIINGYDIPKFYLHKFPSMTTINGHTYRYAIIDGKQRLAAIWQFINNHFPISNEFDYIQDPSIKPRGLTYTEFGRKFPRLKMRFDSFPLSVIAIETDDTDLIEDMFSRLNEAVPLNAAEKRNAFGGPMTLAIRQLAAHSFFKRSLPFNNKRYRHLDIAAKLLLIEESDDVVDTKKVYLDYFVKRWRHRKQVAARDLTKQCAVVLDAMLKKFSASDTLLRSVGMFIIYYHLFRFAVRDGWTDEISRDKFLEFETVRKANRLAAEEDIANADYALLEFDRLTQTPNDAYATQLRLGILLDKEFDMEVVEY